MYSWSAKPDIHADANEECVGKGHEKIRKQFTAPE